MQTEKRPGPPVATHHSEETAAVEKSRKDVETVTWKPHPQVNVTRTAQTNCTDDSDILHDDSDMLHTHWQDTAEQFFSHAYVRFAMIKKGRSIFTRLDYLASSVGCFVSVSFIRSFFACHAFCSRRSFFHSFSLPADLSQLTEGNNSQPESFSLPL